MIEDVLKPHVTVIRGGTKKAERERSMSSGSSVYHTLRADHTVTDVHLTPDGHFEMHGREVDVADLLGLGGVIFSTLSGSDGRELAQLCREEGVAYIGKTETHQKTGSALDQKDWLRTASSHTIPYWRLAHNYDAAEDALYGSILESLRYPVVISPLPDAFSVSAAVVRSEAELMEVLEACFRLEAPVAVSDTYEGNLYAVMVMDSFRGQNPYVFPAHELLHDHEVANAVDHRELEHRPAQVPEDILQLAQSVFSELHLSGLSQVTILETPEDELFVLDVDPHPPLDRHSLLCEVAGEVGSTLSEIFSFLVKDARVADELKKARSQL